MLQHEGLERKTRVVQLTSQLVIGGHVRPREDLRLADGLPGFRGRQLPDELHRVHEQLQVDVVVEVVWLNGRLHVRIDRRCVLQSQVIQSLTRAAWMRFDLRWYHARMDGRWTGTRQRMGYHHLQDGDQYMR